MPLRTVHSTLSGLVFASLTLATAAVAADAPQQAPVEKPVKEKKICRRTVATGSIMAKSVCRTLAEWAEIDKQSQDDVEQIRNRPQGSRPGS